MEAIFRFPESKREKVRHKNHFQGMKIDFVPMKIIFVPDFFFASVYKAFGQANLKEVSAFGDVG